MAFLAPDPTGNRPRSKCDPPRSSRHGSQSRSRRTSLQPVKALTKYGDNNPRGDPRQVRQAGGRRLREVGSAARAAWDLAGLERSRPSKMLQAKSRARLPPGSAGSQPSFLNSTASDVATSLTSIGCPRDRARRRASPHDTFRRCSRATSIRSRGLGVRLSWRLHDRINSAGPLPVSRVPAPCCRPRRAAVRRRNQDPGG